MEKLSNLAAKHFLLLHKYVKKMEVVEKYKKSNLNNSDVKWYLFDDKLWITKYKTYFEIEKNISNFHGSFNWLYDSNDTVLFNEEGKFETAVIDLAGKIENGNLKEYTNIIGTGKKGDLFLVEKKYFSFEFSSTIIYSENEDILLSFPLKFNKRKDLILFIVDDFGFVLKNHQLQGWFLKNSSKHICITEVYNKEITPKILARYLNALKLWEDDEDTTELEDLLAESMNEDNEFNCALRECITNLL